MSTKTNGSRNEARFAEIENAAREVQLQLYAPCKAAHKSGAVDLISIFDPGVALSALSYEVVTVPDLGRQLIGGTRSDVAGLIDLPGKRVEISQKFSATTVRFTTAHELAHAVLHCNQGMVMHRDLPLERAGVIREWREVEANRFASAFLMPRLLVEEEFASRFLTRKFELTDLTAHALCGARATVLHGVFRGTRNLSLCLAGASTFNGAHFAPLHQRFKVSPLAMAIRLEELVLL